MGKLSALLLITTLGTGLISCHSETKTEAKATTASQKADLEPGPDCVDCGPAEAPDSLGYTVSLAPADEPGQRLVLSGRVFYEGSRNPIPDVLLYFYQTNAKGIYPKQGTETGQAKWHGNLRGWLKTDASGKYLVSTIMPGAYPGRTDPAHIHVIAKTHNGPAVFLNDFTFEGDPLLTKEYRNKISKKGDAGIISLNRNMPAIYSGYRDIRLPL